MSLVPRDWQDSGIFLLQHHDDAADIDMRHMMVGARVGKGVGDGTEEELIPIEAEEGMGTVGDIHPWRYWAPTSRGARPMGAWSMVFGAVVTGESPSKGPVTPSSRASRGPGDSVPPGLRPPPGSTGTSGGGEETLVPALPIRKEDYAADGRFKVVEHRMPEGMPEFPAGYLCIAVAGTEEFSQENLLFPADARLIDPNYSGPGSMGSQVHDLEPEGEISPRRFARLQSSWRVVTMPDTIEGLDKQKGYGLAWQLGPSQQDKVAGFGLCYGKVDGGGSATTPGKDEPQTTPSDNPNQGHGAVSGGGHWGIGAGGVGPGNVPGANYTDSQQGAPGGG